MNSLNLLYYSLSAGFLILVGFLCYTLWTASKTMKNISSILKKIDDIAKDVEDFKNFIKYGIIYMKNMLVGKGGDKNDK